MNYVARGPEHVDDLAIAAPVDQVTHDAHAGPSSKIEVNFKKSMSISLLFPMKTSIFGLPFRLCGSHSLTSLSRTPIRVVKKSHENPQLIVALFLIFFVFHFSVCLFTFDRARIS